MATYEKVPSQVQYVVRLSEAEMTSVLAALLHAAKAYGGISPDYRILYNALEQKD